MNCLLSKMYSFISLSMCIYSNNLKLSHYIKHICYKLNVELYYNSWNLFELDAVLKNIFDNMSL